MRLRFAEDSAEAEDFAFRTFETAIRHIDSFHGEGAFYGWMKSILANDISSARRTKAAQNTVVAELDPNTPMPDGGPGTAERLMAAEELTTLQGAKGCSLKDARTVTVAFDGLEFAFVRARPLQ